MLKNLLMIAVFAACVIGCKNTASTDSAYSSEEAEALLRVSSDFTTDKQTYKAGETVVLSLENKSDEDLGYNLCSAYYEQKNENGWLAMPSLRLCTAEVYSLEPGRITTYEYELDASLPAGEYRFVAIIHLLKTEMKGKRISNIFAVEE